MGMSQLNWRFVYLLTIGLRFVLALANSYIHPDEHFQSLEVASLLWLGYHTNIPWEFTSSSPARSYVPLAVLYYPILKLSQYMGLELPLQIWYLSRLVLMVMSWMITDWCLFRMLPTKQERIKAIYFTLTSYVTLVYQSHCFSNSIETMLVMGAVCIINELRFLFSQNDSQYDKRDLRRLATIFGALVAFGIFNRITFAAFLIFPSVFLLQSFWKWKSLLFFAVLSFAVVSGGCVLLDSVLFGSLSLADIVRDPWKASHYVITPLNSLLYNSSIENLGKHGLHPRYNHVLINLPQLFGPGLFLLFCRFRNRYWRTTPFISALSGIVFLSAVPHQELRFLLPVVPLLCSCFDLSLGYKDEAPKKSWLLSPLMALWFVFNIIMGVLMGIFHQGGVVPALDQLHGLQLQDTAQVWWRTYSPPTWMLADRENNCQFITLNADNHKFSFDESKKSYVVDAMGSDFGIVDELIKELRKKVVLVTPIASFKSHFDDSRFRKIWSTPFHLDLDHLDWSDPKTLQPGLAIYELV
uniref:Mannosyltransferase n=1 Tax=Candidozyma auris TaxID=498019 RepID=A0A0L0P729_CANAR